MDDDPRDFECAALFEAIVMLHHVGALDVRLGSQGPVKFGGEAQPLAVALSDQNHIALRVDRPQSRGEPARLHTHLAAEAGGGESSGAALGFEMRGYLAPHAGICADGNATPIAGDIRWDFIRVADEIAQQDQAALAACAIGRMNFDAAVEDGRAAAEVLKRKVGDGHAIRAFAAEDGVVAGRDRAFARKDARFDSHTQHGIEAAVDLVADDESHRRFIRITDSLVKALPASDDILNGGRSRWAGNRVVSDCEKHAENGNAAEDDEFSSFHICCAFKFDRSVRIESLISSQEPNQWFL